MLVSGEAGNRLEIIVLVEVEENIAVMKIADVVTQSTDNAGSLLRGLRCATRPTAMPQNVQLNAPIRTTAAAALDADSAFQELLGKDSAPRYKFIMEKADQAAAEELDI